jgi:hypothetical protein
MSRHPQATSAPSSSDLPKSNTTGCPRRAPSCSPVALLHPSNKPHLYRRIFRRKFDLAAIARRFPSCVVASRFHPALCCINLGNIHHPQSEGAFLVTYIMLPEHDALSYLPPCRRRPSTHPVITYKYIAERPHRGQNDWPTEDMCNVLAVALFWHDGVFLRSHFTLVDLTLFP